MSSSSSNGVFRRAVIGGSEISQNSSSVSLDPNFRTKTLLINRLQRKLAASPFIGDGAYSRAMSHAMSLSARIMPESSPTPQPAVDEDDGTIEISWLVNGTEVLLTLTLDGEGSIEILDPEGDEKFTAEFESRSGPEQRSIAYVQDVLRELGSRVAHRIA